MNETEDFTVKLIRLLGNVKEIHGDNAIVKIRSDYYDVIVEDVTTGQILYDSDTLIEFTDRFYRSANT